MITTAGREWLAQLMVNEHTEYLTYIAVGFGTTTESIADTALENEQFRALTNYTRDGNVITFTLTIPPGDATGDITEAGVFSNSSGPTLYDRVTFPVKTKSSGDSLVITWTETIG